MSVQNEFDQMNADEDDQLFFVTSYSDFDKLGKFLYHTTFTDDTVQLLPPINIPHILRCLLACIRHPCRSVNSLSLAQLTVLVVQKQQILSTYINSIHQMDHLYC